MADVLRPELLFQRSRRCSQGGCVEVAFLPDGGAVVRDSTDPSLELPTFSKQEWRRFVACVKNGQLDL